MLPKWSSVIVALCAIILAAGIEAKNCGYKSCPATNPKLLNIHLVPHSHDDVGWLKTVDQYYYGSKIGIQRAGVQYILDSVLDELQKDSRRRFIQVESAFFFKWYAEQSEANKKIVKKLVENGQFEFIGGAWSMNDEAAVHYQSVIDQFTLGLKKLEETFGECGRPRVGWQIDPFGHSREMASIFAQMGYDGEFFARIDWREKSPRLEAVQAEMIWKASSSLGKNAELFTGLLYNHYSAPPSFCFDVLCSDDPIIDGNSTDNNVKQRVDDFISYVGNVTKYYRTNHLMVPMGDDFNYQSAEMNYKNMDKLIKYVNERQKSGSKINIVYSTPSCYLKSLHEQLTNWPVKLEDFFPYSTDQHSYWTGYYSSRPTQKRFERYGNHMLQTCKQLTYFGNLSRDDEMERLDNLRKAMGVMQHHDAITGTEKQKVAQDYDRMLYSAIVGCESNMQQALRKLTNITKGEFESCHLANISSCSLPAKNDKFVLTLFNPLGKNSTQYVRIPVQRGTYEVRDNASRIVPSDVVSVPLPVLKIPYRLNATQHELVFQATVNGVQSFYIRRVSKARETLWNVLRPRRESPYVINAFNSAEDSEESDESQESEESENKIVKEPRLKHVEKTVPTLRAGPTVVENTNVRLTFSTNGKLSAIRMNGVNLDISQDFFYYPGALGNNEVFKNRSSGAYIFRPNGTEVLISNNVALTVIKGNMVQEVHQVFNPWISQVIRIYRNLNRVEFEWLVGPIPIKDNLGKEVITRLQTNIKSNGVFYTDSNGREILKRTRNGREFFKPNLTEKVSANYYPITSKIALEDDKTRIAVLNDRAQGGSSLKDGGLELMLHRRLLHDDAFGVGEALNESAYGEGVIARGKYYLIVSSPKEKQSVVERQMQHEILLPFASFYSTQGKDMRVPVKSPPAFNFLPNGIHLLTLEPWSKKETLVRLEHYLDATEASKISFNMLQLFNLLDGSKIRETTLDGSKPLGDMKRMKFSEYGTAASRDQYMKPSYTPLNAGKKDKPKAFDVTFIPMQIRTFIIKKD